VKNTILAVAAVAGLWGCGGAVEEDTGSSTGRFRIPIEVEGVRYSAEEANERFGQQELIFFVDKEAEQQGFAYAFTSKTAWDVFSKKWEQTHPRPEISEQDYDPDLTYLYEHSYLGGKYITVPSHTSVDDLTDYWCVPFWNCSNWNDRVSSAKGSKVNRYTILYEHINYGGSWVVLPSDGSIVNMPDVGFNDTASSLSFTAY
jgi:hypothetical protein